MARVLVIDDEPDVVRLILKVLSGRGHVPQVARDGASALARVHAEAPDVILCDSDLPKIDGAEVCRQLKADARTKHIPVVMMTSSYIDIYDVGSENGPDAFVVRPFVREVLANVVERALYPAVSDAGGPGAGAKVPFTVLTGWLGAGKTTALNRMLAAPGGRRIAVLINELGRISIDTQLIVGAGGDVLELAGGCVCCKVDLKNDLWDGIVDVVMRSRPDHVVLETTGIAEPEAILEGLAREIQRPLREGRGDRASDVIEPAGVVCVVDAETGGAALGARDEARAQAAAADRVLVAKLDVASAEAVAACHARLDELAPKAERASFPPGAAGAAAMTAWIVERRAVRIGGGHAHAHAHDVAHRHGQLVAVAFTDDAPLVAERVMAVLAGLGDRLVRAKGFVHAAGDPRRAFVERAGVRTQLTWGEPWPSSGRRTTELVLIGDDLDEPSLHRALWACRSRDGRDQSTG